VRFNARLNESFVGVTQRIIRIVPAIAIQIGEFETNDFPILFGKPGQFLENFGGSHDLEDNPWLLNCHAPFQQAGVLEFWNYFSHLILISRARA